MINLTIKMRTLIYREFGILLSLQENDATTKLCKYGFKSRQLKLQNLARRLAAQALVPLPKIENNEDSFVEFLCSDNVAFPIRIKGPRIPEFIIDKSQHRCLINIPLKKLVILRDYDVFKNLSITPFIEHDADRLQQPLNSINLDSFLWFCGKQLSQDKLLKSLESFQAISLKQWPDFGRLQHNHEDILIATILMRKAGSLETLLTQSKIIRQKAIAFLNACYLCGWLTEGEMAVPLKSSMFNTTRHKFLGRIRLKLRMQG
jgi:hypothetical protein